MSHRAHRSGVLDRPVTRSGTSFAINSDSVWVSGVAARYIEHEQ